ncbi:MAG: hypothetical protein PHS80_01730 [Methanothrix sp.]|nr:hypothetical protein [Methanothrix sp.]MDD4446214.1 hypothetical protein [Methanothrix sp.]
MVTPEELHDLDRKRLSKIASRELKTSGPRMDAVFYLLDAWRLFRGKLRQKIQEITFEIDMQGQYELDVNDIKETHILRALPMWYTGRKAKWERIWWKSHL